MITYSDNLNVVPGGVPAIFHLNQYEDDFRLVLTLYSSVGELAISAGTKAEIRGTKTDGKGYSASCTLDSATGTVTVAGHKQMTAVAGNQKYEIVLASGRKDLYTANFYLLVEPAALSDETDVSETVLPSIIEGARADAESAAQSAADALAYKNAAAQSEANALSYKNSASTSATAAATAKNDAVSARTAAQSAQSAAESARAAAQQSATDADASAKLSKSWAAGGTGTRTGEDTDNAKYWAEKAGKLVGAAVTYTDEIIIEPIE